MVKEVLGPARGRAGRALLDAGPHRRARHGDGAARAADERTGSTSWWTGSRAATPQTFNGRQVGAVDLAARRRRATATSTRRAARWATGCRSRTARSRATSAWCRAPGTARRATTQGQTGPYEAALMDNHPLAQSRAAARDPAHHPLLRPVHGVRRARARRHRRPGRGGQGPMTHRRPAGPGAPRPHHLPHAVPPRPATTSWVYLWDVADPRHALGRGRLRSSCSS